MIDTTSPPENETVAGVAAPGELPYLVMALRLPQCRRNTCEQEQAPTTALRQLPVAPFTEQQKAPVGGIIKI